MRYASLCDEALNFSCGVIKDERLRCAPVRQAELATAAAARACAGAAASLVPCRPDRYLPAGPSGGQSGRVGIPRETPGYSTDYRHCYLANTGPTVIVQTAVQPEPTGVQSSVSTETQCIPVFWPSVGRIPTACPDPARSDPSPPADIAQPARAPLSSGEAEGAPADESGPPCRKERVSRRRRASAAVSSRREAALTGRPSIHAGGDGQRRLETGGGDWRRAEETGDGRRRLETGGGDDRPEIGCRSDSGGAPWRGRDAFRRESSRSAPSIAVRLDGLAVVVCWCPGRL